ncbi:MAG: acyltransferase [Xanthomonadales bacterium]|nr:acyltransferase [Xanthomonadales bacterium]|tara:strand:+ start:1123 stop:2037 length:915 start_codon:yes stop_codon:yes gene_type:complete
MRFLRVPLAPLLILAATLVLIVPMIVAAAVKLLLPFTSTRRLGRRIVAGIAEMWMWIVVRCFRISYRTRIEVTGDTDFDRSHSYLLLCNHLSWVDVPVLLWAFCGQLPFYRFFLKRSLIWMPLLGIAFWALEYPFIRFRSREYLERHPEKRGEGLETARRACERLEGVPSTIVNFPEGAINTPERHRRQRPGHRNLLRAHAGGPSLVISAMGEQLDALLDVTIQYPDGPPSVADFMLDRVERVRVHVRRIPIPDALVGGNYQDDPEFRAGFRAWINDLWRSKDALIEELKTRRTECDRDDANGE